MAIRTIYVDKGDLIQVRVMGNDLEDKNKKGWEASAIRPYQFLFRANKYSISITDPGAEIYLTNLTGDKSRRIF